MIRFLNKLPSNVVVAVSGGADSMAILDFLKRKSPRVLHFNHGTEHGYEAENLVKKYCSENNLELCIGRAKRNKFKSESMEEFWRNIRYEFLESATSDNIITCHNLDDQIEQWIFSSLHGKPGLIPYARNNIIRPFILTKKKDLELWCQTRDVPYIVDPGNSNPKYMRSFIRTSMVPNALVVNPGLYKVIFKKVKESYSNS